MVKRLLITDDENFIRQAYKDGFTRAGFEVDTAADGEEALAKLHQASYDLLLLDLIMPKINGFEVLKAVKSEDGLKELRVLILSNLSQATDEQEARSLGATDFIIKSDYSMQKLIEVVESLIGKASE